MLWTIHKRIVLKICEEFQFLNVETNRFIEGVIAPDNWNNYSHNHGRSKTIREWLLKAHGLFLRVEFGDVLDNTAEAGFYRLHIVVEPMLRAHLALFR